VGRKMRTESLELGSMWRSFNATSYATEKVGLPGAMASLGRQERVAGGCGEVLHEGDDLLCGCRGLPEEARHPRWRLWVMGLGSGGVGGMGIGMGSGTGEEGRRWWNREALLRRERRAHRETPCCGYGEIESGGGRASRGRVKGKR
jgi:hypothetical protein